MRPVLQRFPSVAAALFVFILLWSPGCTRIWERVEPEPNRTQANQTDPTPSVNDLPHLLFGNPSRATADPGDPDNYLIVGEISAISYNNSRGTANWISWKTTTLDLGPKLPRPDFQPDPRLPSTFRRIGYYDYSGSGFDRGHLLPSADRFGSQALNGETFYMSNIVPQTGDLNQFPWEQLESYARSLARRGNDVYSIAGVYGEQGKLRGKVTIPTNCWKIVAVLKRGFGPKSLDINTRLIAVDMPNIKGVDIDSWKRFRTSIRAIEQQTGYDFFADLPINVQDVLETSVDDK